MDRLQLLEALNLSTFIAFDFETTGLSADDDRLIEIAAIRFVNGQAQDRFVTLVNPGMEISPLIADITGITNAMVKDAPAEEDVVDEFLKFLGSAPLVAHNIPFDLAFLKALRQRYGKPDVAHDLYDTLQLSRVFLFFRPAHNLGSVAEFFNLNADDAHRAESDTENCGQVFLSLVEEAASYPLGVVTKLLEILKHVDVHNKAFYVNLANALTRTGDLKNGLVKSTIEKPVNDNLYIHRGSRDSVDFSVREVFGPDGVLKKTLANFEYRSQQLEYAEFVDQALGDNRIAVVEAGTGLGKTQAYLYPSIKRTFNKEDQGPTIISCHTKHLQDQLFYKDLPMLAEALDLSLQAVMLKGRNNYICRTRLGWVIADAGRNLNPLEAESLLPLVIWLEWTQTGDLSECTGFWSFRQNRIAAMIRSEPGFCTSPLCARHQGCFFGPLRRNTFNARVIVVNHALLLAETRNPGVLPPFSSVVIDEAHNLVSAAYGQFTLAVDQNLITGLIQRIDLDSAGAVRLKNRLTELAKLHSGLERPLADLLHDTARAHSANRSFFDEYTAQVGSRFRVDSPYTEKHLIESLAEEFSAVDQELKALELTLKELVLTLQKIERELNKIDSDQNDYTDLIQVFEQARQQFGELLENLASLTRRQQDDWVYWQEGYYRTFGRKQPELTLNLCAAPVDVSGALVDSLFAALDSAVLTSATLRIDDSFEYFLHRTGLDRPELTNVVTTDIASPFYYQDQVKYFQLGGAQNGSKDPVFIAELIYQCHKHYGKRMMVLFTSWAMLNGCYNALRQKPEGRSLPIYAQRATTSRYALIKGMSETPNGILLGTDAFWEGIDLPGELLEILIITKLPFAVPSEPLIKAYSDLLNRQGRNSFLEFSVPEAVIKFRQGFGRLIRSTTDEGIFIVLDERIVAKRYGSYFRDVIPTPMSVFQSIHELLF
ncbi:MAG: helicase C-terminal domain-containing protein [Candidatus Neomarinimicrobiota bacterium]